jgi:hypothetical protein
VLRILLENGYGRKNAYGFDSDAMTVVPWSNEQRWLFDFCTQLW